MGNRANSDDGFLIEEFTSVGLLVRIQYRQKRLPEINQSPDELGAMSEKQQRFIMAERQKILQALCDKITVFTDGRIILGGLIEVK
jgi:hypothetical protein